MATLSLSLLGSFTATFNSQPLHKFQNLKVQALLIYLGVERDHPHRRESLFTLLWPGMPEKSARHNLSQTLYTLRQTFPAVNAYGSQEMVPLILANRLTIQLNPEASMDADIHQLDRLLQKTQTHEHMNLVDCQPCIKSLEQAVDLYNGDFLTGFYLEDSNQFEDWATSNREAYRRKTLEAFQTLTDISTQKEDYIQASAYAERQLAIDKLNESAHRQMMEILARSNRRVEALRQYREYVTILDDEMGVSPSSETMALYERIQAEVLPPSSQVHFDAKPEEASTIPHNLLPLPTPFIGREAELADLDRYIADPDTRLITIVAPGGMGKTRLAISCAERQLGSTNASFPHGVFFIPCAQVNEVDRIELTIAEAINLQIESSVLEKLTARQQVLQYLQQKEMLLLFDNFEHLLDATDLITDIFIAAPKLQIMVTSRERLQLHAEQVYSLGSLPIAEGERPEKASKSPAAQLFIQSARRVQPGFELTENEHNITLANICRLVGGMPLALELAAGWVDMLSLAEIASEVEHSLDFLETELRDIPERHRGINAVFDSTWKRMDEVERGVLARFSVFRGGCTRDAAQTVTGASLRMLASLRNKSLIQYRRAGSRYSMHELMRQYAAEKLALAPEVEAEARKAHCTYYCSLLAGLNSTLKSARQRIAIKAISADYENILIAWRWAVDHREIESLSAAVGCLGEYFELTHRQFEAEAVFSQAIQKIETSFGPKPAPAEANRLLAHLLAQQVYKIRESLLTTWLYGNEHSEKILLRALTLLETASLAGEDTRLEEAFIHLQLGRVECVEKSKKREHLERSLHLYKSIGDEVGVADVLNNIGIIARAKGFQESRMFHNKSLAILRQVGDPERISQTLMRLGEFEHWEMNEDKTFQFYEEAYAAARSGDHPEGMAKVRRETAFQAWGSGKFDLALRYQEEGLALCRRAGNRTLESIFLMQIGLTKVYQGQFLQAIEPIQEGEAIYQLQDQNYKLFLALAHIHAGQYTMADQILVNLLDDPWKLRQQAWMELADRNYKKALTLSEKSKSLAQYGWLAWTQAALACALHGLGQRERAKRELYDAVQVCVKYEYFLPLMHLMPVISVVMVDDEFKELKIRAVELYALAESLPFVGNSKLFEAITGRYIREAIAHLPQDEIKAAEVRGQAFDWWGRTEMLLDELRELGWDSVDS